MQQNEESERPLSLVNIEEVDKCVIQNLFDLSFCEWIEKHGKEYTAYSRVGLYYLYESVLRMQAAGLKPNSLSGSYCQYEDDDDEDEEDEEPIKEKDEKDEEDGMTLTIIEGKKIWIDDLTCDMYEYHTKEYIGTYIDDGPMRYYPEGYHRL